MIVDPVTRDAVMKHLHAGRTVDVIDRLLDLPKGTAHDVVVDFWFEDKMRSTSAQRSAALRRWRENAARVDGADGIECDGE